MTNSLVPFGTQYPEFFDDFRRELDAVMGRFLGRDLTGDGNGAG